jgi:hypothetical protein
MQTKEYITSLFLPILTSTCIHQIYDYVCRLYGLFFGGVGLTPLGTVAYL